MKRLTKISSVMAITLVALGAFLVAPALQAADTGATGGSQSHSTMQPTLAMNYIIALEGLYPSRNRGENDPMEGGGDHYLGEIRIFGGNFAPRGWAFCQGQLLAISTNNALFSLLGTIYGGDGRTTFGLPDLRGRAAIGFGQGPGLSNYSIGTKIGAETVNPTLNQLATHGHSLDVGNTNNTGGSQSFNNRQPTIALNYLIALQGDYYYLHEMRLFGGNFAIRSWAMAQGQLLSISSNQTLYSQIGSTFGGDGRTTVAIPDLRGRVAVGSGQGSGLSSHLKGSRFGNENTTMSTSTMPSHSHTTSGNNTGNTGGSQTINNLQPTLTIRYYIAQYGYYPSRSFGDSETEAVEPTPMAVDPMMGEVRLFAGSSLDGNWLPCEGQLLSISANTALFSLLGTIYGGDGRTTFALPDLRGRTPIGFGQGIGLSSHSLGSISGTEYVSLSTSQIPSHVHGLPATYPGDVPDSGTPLQISKVGDGTLDLTWGGSCGTGGTGYSVYQGSLGAFASHALVSGTCDQNNSFLYSHSPGSGDTYYLISATDNVEGEEGGLGADSTGTSRPLAASTCMGTVNTNTCN